MYIILLLFSPIVSRGLNNLKRNEHKLLLIIMLTLWCLIPTFIRRDMYGNQLLWYLFLVCSAGYIRKYNPFKQKSTLYLSLAAAVLSFEWGVTYFIDCYNINIPSFGNNVPYFYDYRYIPTFLIALLVFAGFLQLDLRPNKYINIVASTMFGVYLLHDYPLMRDYLWRDVLSLDVNTDNFVVKSIVRVLVVVVTCSLIELIRNKLFRLLRKIYI